MNKQPCYKLKNCQDFILVVKQLGLGSVGETAAKQAFRQVNLIFFHKSYKSLIILKNVVQFQGGHKSKW